MAPEVVITTTSGATIDNTVGIMTTFMFSVNHAKYWLFANTSGLYFKNPEICVLLLLCNSGCHPICVIPATEVCPCIYQSPTVGFMNMLLICLLYGHLVRGTFTSQETLDVGSLATVGCCKNMIQYNMILHTALQWLLAKHDPELNSSTHGQNGRHFTDDIFKCIFMNAKFCI